jgi:predicted NUDIX family NTP pyrophosphohydrolase
MNRGMGRGKAECWAVDVQARGKTLEVFLVHPGGPFWAKKDLGAWSIPKGEYADGENPLGTARRESKQLDTMTIYKTICR